MKIALVIKDFIAHKGGAERYSCLLAKGLADRGHEVHVYANQWEETDSRLTFHHVPMVRWSSFLKIISFPRNVQRLLSQERFDVVQGLTPLWSQDLYRVGEGLHADALRMRYPSLFTRLLRYINPKHLAILWTERQMFRPDNCRRVVTNSRMCKGRVQELYCVPASAVDVIYNGVDQGIYHPGTRRQYREKSRQELGFNDSDIVLLFVSMDFVRKGLAYLLEAHARLRREGVRLKTLVVGKGKVDEYRGMAERLGIRDEVVFVPPTRETERYYAAGDVLVLPTLYDPFSNVCLEALACGLPVITTRQNGAAELIKDGVNGYVIGSGADVQSLADAVRQGIPAMKEMGRKAAETAEAFTVESNVMQMEEVYSRILSAKRGAPDISETDGVFINNDFLPLLQIHNLASFGSLITASEGEAFKDISHRSVTRLALGEGNRTRTLYLKRHYEKGVSAGQSGGMFEWGMILKFLRHGIPTMTPVAAGVKQNGDVTESLLVTDALEGYQRMEIFMRDRYRRPLGNDLVREKRSLIKRTAELSAKMHYEGFNHRDFYLTHIMVKPMQDGDFDLRIIDLQRVQERRWFRRRWLVKDLASLNFAAKDDYTTRTDRLRFLLAYLGKNTLDRPGKAFIRAILAKTRRIGAHDESATAKKLAYAAKSGRSVTR